MTISKDGQPAEQDGRSNYEAAVLDFLDKEMAGAQLPLTEKKQSEDLDALVAGLLQQVISEADQPSAAGPVVSDEMKDLFAEFEPQTGAAPAPKSASAKPESFRNEDAREGEGFAAEEAALIAKEFPAEEPERPETSAPEASVFAAKAARKNRTPMIAAAAACLLVLAGGAVYYFMKPPGVEPAPAASRPAVQTPAPPVATPASQAAAEPAAAPGTVETRPAAAPAAAKKPATTAAKDSAAAAPAQNLPAKQTAAAPLAPAANTVVPPPVKEEKPVAAAVPPAVAEAKPAETPAAQPVPEVASSVVAQKPVLPVVTQRVAPVSMPVARKLEPRAPVIPAKTEPAPPAAKAEAPLPVVQPSLVAAVPITQVSPKFPDIALRTRTSATVTLTLDVDSQGRVTRATPVGGPEMFHREAVNAAMKWRYKPASVGGSNVSSQVKVIFNFNLKK